jgi:hypothetical protein
MVYTLPPNSLFIIVVEEEILELRKRCRKIFSILSCPVKYSVRKISELVEISKSSIHRFNIQHLLHVAD